MARGRQLTQLVTDVRLEVGQSPNAGVGSDFVQHIKHQLRAAQMELYDKYDWPHLKIWPSIQMQAGERYHDVPEDLDYERLEAAVIWWGGQPYDLERGITLTDYAVFNSDENVRSDPVQKWDIRWIEDPAVPKEMLEFWPLPASNDGRVQFEGFRRLRPLLADADVADLDDRLLILRVAAEILENRKRGSGQGKAALLNDRLNTMKVRTKGTGGLRVLLGNRPHSERPRLRVRM